MKHRDGYQLLLLAAVPVCLALTSCGGANQVGAGGGNQQSLASAEQQLKNALAADQKQYGANSAQAAADLVKLGDLYRTEGKMADSGSTLQRAMDMYKAQTDGSALSMANCMNSLGLTFIAQGNFKQAENLLQQALSMRESNKAEPAAIAESEGSLGQLYYEGGVLPEAKQWFEKSYATAKSSCGTDSIQLAEAQNNVAGVYFAEGKLEQAEQMFQSSLTIYQNALGHDRPEVADCLNNLGEVYRAEGKFSQAEPEYKDAIDIYQKISQSSNSQHPNLAACLNNLALLYQKQKNYDKAEPLYKQALTLEESANSNTKRDLSNTLSNYAKLLHATNRETEAKAMDLRVNTMVASQ